MNWKKWNREFLGDIGNIVIPCYCCRFVFSLHCRFHARTRIFIAFRRPISFIEDFASRPRTMQLRLKESARNYIGLYLHEI